MSGKSVGIIIPVHNRIAHTVRCLDSIFRNRHREFFVYVVDDGSTDGTRTVLAQKYPKVKVIPGDGNLWWTRATNLGIREALNGGAQYILLLNNDNLVSEETVGELLRVSRLKGNAVVGSVVVAIDKGEKLVKHASLYNGVDWGVKARNPFHNRFIVGLPEILPTEILSGQGSLIPKWVFDRVGFLDEINFPHYMGDFDFFMRCGRKDIPMFVAGRAIVEDDVAATGIHMSSRKIPTFYDFIRSLIVVNSHRNVKTNVKYFRKYCKSPITCLCGLTIFYSGYVVSFLMARLGMVRIRESLIRRFS